MSPACRYEPNCFRTHQILNHSRQRDGGTNCLVPFLHFHPDIEFVSQICKTIGRIQVRIDQFHA